MSFAQHLGTPKEVLSSEGALLWSSDHDTWGSLRTIRAAFVSGDYWTEEVSETTAVTASISFCPIRFQGQWEDAETGLYQNRFRYYDPDARQYASADPIGILGGQRPHSYVYASTGAVDPSGLARTGEAGVVNGVLCIVNIYSPSGRSPDAFRASEFDGFIELWDENARATSGGLTRRSVSASDRRRADANNSRIRCCNPGMFPDRETVVGHLPDMGWGGAAVPSAEGWVPLDRAVNGFIGNATGRVPVGTTYNSVRSVASIDDC